MKTIIDKIAVAMAHHDGKRSWMDLATVAFMAIANPQKGYGCENCRLGASSFDSYGNLAAGHSCSAGFTAETCPAVRAAAGEEEERCSKSD